MAFSEAILVAGAPGSGKSSIAKRFVEIGEPDGVRHLSIGDLKRSITAGETPSAFAEMLREIEHPDRKTGAAPSEAMTGIMEEFILQEPGKLVLIDGFPRYMDRVEPFRESIAKIGVDVLALCVVEVSESAIHERLGSSGRKTREGQKLKDPSERLADHYANVVPVLDVLSQDYPRYELNGELPLDESAAHLLEIYNRHTTLGV